MKRKFNVLGNCIPGKHYMVDISDKLTQIQEMVDEGLYFTINRARQYGKTTTLGLLEKRLQGEYIVVRMSFEAIGSLGFETEEKFSHMFMEEVAHCLNDSTWNNPNIKSLKMLSRHITKMCDNKKIVLMIDEVDKTCNNQIFLLFLGLLRSKYLDRNDGRDTTFHSVILVGVVDIRNIKIVMEQKGLNICMENEGGTHSPWNIAADFEVDMSFSPADITSMLKDYESDYNTGMDIAAIAEEIYIYTSGYPFLVSRICQHIDRKLGKDWTADGVQAAVKILLTEKNTLFDDMSKNLENYDGLREFTRSILIDGEPKKYMPDNPLVDFGIMFGYFTERNGQVAISNRIFEIRMTNYFISKNESDFTQKRITGVLKEEIVIDGKFDMALCIKKFAQHYYELFSSKDETFYERHGRLLFLSYLQPLINGKGFYHIEAQTRNTKRMDIIVSYGTDQFIVELKLWRGESNHEKAYDQLLGYMESKNTNIGYLLTFDFSKNPKPRKPQWVDWKGRRIFDVII